MLLTNILNEETVAKRVDLLLGIDYRKLKIGTKLSSMIFIYSFPQGPASGITIKELKKCAASLFCPSSVIDQAINELLNFLY